MSFAEEIQHYTDEELELIISTQKDLYSEEEMAQLKALQSERKRLKREEYEARVLSRLPETISCEKCDGPNLFSNKYCDFCGHKLNKTKYYTDEYYEWKEDDEEPEESSGGDSYTFHYIISILVPLVGFIVGAVMLANDDTEKRSCGKICIILGIASMIVSMIVSAAIIGAF